MLRYTDLQTINPLNCVQHNLYILFIFSIKNFIISLYMKAKVFPLTYFTNRTLYLHANICITPIYDISHIAKILRILCSYLLYPIWYLYISINIIFIFIYRYIQDISCGYFLKIFIFKITLIIIFKTNCIYIYYYVTLCIGFLSFWHFCISAGKNCCYRTIIGI